MAFGHNDVRGPYSAKKKKAYQCLTDLSTIFNIGLETNKNTHHKILRVSGHQQLNLFVIGAYGTKQKHK